MKQQEKLVLIDGNALVHRAFHALPPLSQKGEPTNAVYGFTSVLIKVIHDLKPDYMIATFDLSAPTFRHNEFAEYKAHRLKTPEELVSQFPKVKEVVRALNIPIYEMAGFEADDIIGTIAEKLKQQPNVQCVIITGDLDTLQLVDDNHTIVYTLKKGISDTVIYDEKAVLDRFEGLKPSQLNDFKGLKGDPSDNIPGVPGIGEKTAIKLLLEYGSIDGVYDNIALIPKKLSDKLSEYKDQAFFSKKLATMRKDVPIEFDFKQAIFGDYDIKKVEDVFKKFGFTTMIHRLKSELIHEVKKEIGIDLAIKSSLGSPDDIATIKKSGIIAVSVSRGAVFVAVDSARAYEYSFADIKEVLEDHQIRKIGYDLKKSYKELKRKNISLRGIYFDIGIVAHLASSDSANYSVTNVMRYEFKRDMVLEDSARYESMCAFVVFKKLEEALKKEGMSNLFSEIEMPLVPILAQMELLGVKVDRDKLSKLSLLLEKEKERSQKNIYNLSGEEFNIDSPAQLSKILFEKLAIIKTNKTKKTKTGIFTTKAEALDQLRDAHPIVPLVLEYRELAKLKNTYVDALVEYIDSDGRT
ncbi:MAG: DNA polymerase, partial [Patescibacteria group bacterium]